MQFVRTYVQRSPLSSGIKAISRYKLRWGILALFLMIFSQLLPTVTRASDQMRVAYQASCPRLEGDGQRAGSIPSAGEQECFEFIGNSGEQATLLVTNQTTEGARRLELRLLSPDLSELGSDTSSFAGADVQLINEPLPDSGLYTVIVTSIDDTVGDFTLNFSIGVAPTPTPTNTPTNTVTNTPTNTPTNPPTNTATNTPTNTPTNTSTHSPTPTPTNTPTNTPTPTLPPPDAFEIDDSCTQARTIPSDGRVQEHTFHKKNDVDWVTFDATVDTIYLLEAQIPSQSRADAALELYSDCASDPDQTQDNSFSVGVRLEFRAKSTGPIYLRLTNHDANLFGSDAVYNLSVRALATDAPPGALILVGGRVKMNDPLQLNIDHVTEEVYRLFRNQGYADEDILYLSHDEEDTRVDGPPTTAAVRDGITKWAASKVGTNRPLTLYLMDHGVVNGLYLDKPQGQTLAPSQLDSWLNELEASKPDLAVNVFIEMCYAGSFIQGPNEMSKAGRVVVASTNDQNLAFASEKGAHFSDHFIPALEQGSSIFSSFQTARAAAQAANSLQQPWLDGDGDGVPNEQSDGEIAAQRGFGFAGTLSEESWPPLIREAMGPTSIESNRGVIEATVLDDVEVDDVWAVIYSPSYVSPNEGEEIAQETSILPTIVLQRKGNNRYAAEYPGFDERGIYRIVIYADDNEGLFARPVSIDVDTGRNIFLPLVRR
ncbi:C13 family peptidase [Chloroflexi bacterium TSY]|nr:C13 family peptidase [Chloroflexi bacterium TSY]